MQNVSEVGERTSRTYSTRRKDEKVSYEHESGNGFFPSL